MHYPSFSSLKGLFYYYHVIRKDFLNKFCFLSLKQLPSLQKISLSVQTNQKEKDTRVSEGPLLNWILLLEFLTNSICKVTPCNIVELDHFTSLKNYKFSVIFKNFTQIYELFFFIYFFWFRGVIHVIENFDVPAGRVVKDKFKRKLDIISIEYFKFNRPKFYREKFFKKRKKMLNEPTLVKSTLWMDFVFCKFIPIHITDSCTNLNLNLQFFFNIKLNENQQRVFFSSFKLFHRFKELKKYKRE